MNLFKNIICFCFCSFLLSQNTIDGIVAIVGKQPILHSDVLQQSQIVAVSKNIDPLNNPYAFQSIYDNTKNNMINQYVILDVAENDTNIIVTDEEIEKTLNDRIENFILQAGSKKEFEKILGMPLRKIKAEYWEEIKNMLFMEKYKYSAIQNITISRKEIESFYLNYKDSIPSSPEYYDFSVINIPFVPSEKTKNKTYVFLDSLRNIIINDNVSFESLAKIHSDDPGSKNNGGNLGYTNRGSLVLEYEEAAYSLNNNEISLPVESQFGYHIIKLIDKKGEKISTQHILKTISFFSEDKIKTKANINKLKKITLNDPFMFDSIAVNYQNKYKNFSGKYENKPINLIPDILLGFLKKTTINSISEPIKLDSGYLLIFLYNHKKEFFPSIENSWQLIEQYALQEKQSRIFNNIINNLKENTFIQYY